ncbi:hypothetical protein, partial [Candidatus Erwinia dacicola]|uniref:hypothetical protein n=1 Tax=Candidatus Erwinia dacicola TaxID=252393 RepID=UPI003B8497EB
MHDWSSALYSAPCYIPRPAKLLFTVDDGWNPYLEKHSDSVSQWTQLGSSPSRWCKFRSGLPVR